MPNIEKHVIRSRRRSELAEETQFLLDRLDNVERLAETGRDIAESLVVKQTRVSSSMLDFGKAIEGLKQYILEKVSRLVADVSTAFTQSNCFHVATPSTETRQIGIVPTTRKYVKWLVKVGTGAGSGESLLAQLKQDGNAIGSITIDEDSAVDELIEVGFSVVKSVKGSVLTLDLTHTAGGSPALADIYLSAVYMSVPKT